MPPKQRAKQSLPPSQRSSFSQRQSKRMSSVPMPGAKLKSKKDDDNDTVMGDGAHDDHDWMNAKTLVKPDDQLQLTDEELKEEYTRILTANNPHAPQNIVRYSFKERSFKQTSSVDQLAIHFSLDGNMIHRESDEARRQLARHELGSDGSQSSLPSTKGSSLPAPEESGEKIDEEPEAGAGEGETVEQEAEQKEEGEGGEAGDAGGKKKKKGAKKITNQFNFSERASQTYNNPLRERGTATEPPPRATISGSVTQWEIFDAYQEDFEKQQALALEKSKEKKAVPGKKDDDKGKKKLTVVDQQNDDVTRFARAAKIAERMVNQNVFDDVSQDFKYYEDASDEYRDKEGTLLPLWEFTCEKSKKLAVTAICWSPKYLDMFAVGHGSYDFVKQTNGMIMIYSLKNPAYPEFVYSTESGVMCLDIHPKHPHLLAVGFYDGSVGVFNVTDPCPNPIYHSTAKTDVFVFNEIYRGKHTDPVWQVRWQKDDLDNNLNFFSVSSDGRVTCWTMVKNELHFHDIITLSIDSANNAEKAPQEAALKSFGLIRDYEILGGGTTFDFHQEKDYLFLVGTEEGKIHVCSKAYSSTFLDTYDAHHMAVYKVKWNHFHPRIYITCSADWTVKIWDRGYMKKEPVFVFDLNSAVGDVAWAPYSSTVFAAATADGKVHVFDLSQNKYEAVCEQIVTRKKKTKLTHISFNSKHPILIVGDDRGYVTSLKLSPNLRKVPKAKKAIGKDKKGAESLTQEQKDAAKKEAEIKKMDDLLRLAYKQPPAPTRPEKESEAGGVATGGSQSAVAS